MRLPSSFTKEDRMACRFIKRMQGGDPDGLTALYALYQGPVLALIIGILRDKGAAEEVFQDAFARAYEQAERFDPRLGTPFSWLGTIARRMAIDRLRRQTRHREIFVREGEQVGTPRDTIDKNDFNGSSRELEAKLVLDRFAELPQRERKVLELAFLGGFTQQEIAGKLEMPLGTVKSDLRRGLERLRKVYLGEDDRR